MCATDLMIAVLSNPKLRNEAGGDIVRSQGVDGDRKKKMK